MMPASPVGLPTILGQNGVQAMPHMPAGIRRRRLCGAALAAALVFAPGSAGAQPPGGAAPAGRDSGIPDALSRGTPGWVREIVDADTLFLRDGREIRLVGLQAPKLPLGRAGFEKWPLADEAKAVLAELVEGRRVTPAYGGKREDRYARKLAHLFRDDGLWVQAEMLRRGMARVYSFADNRTLVRELQAIESKARRAGRGIWAKPYYRVRTRSEVRNDVGSFQLVMGRIREAAEVDGRIYLNFGTNWRKDFTVMIPPEHTTTFTEAGMDPTALAGRWVRVRGWIEDYNGPMIEATHPEQIEVIP